MAILYTPSLSANPDSNEVATEINWITMCIEDLDENSATYETDKAYYEQIIDSLLPLLDDARSPQDDYYNMNMDGAADSGPGHQDQGFGFGSTSAAGGDSAGSSASSAYSSPCSGLPSPVTPNPTHTSGRKRSQGHGFEMSESKRQSVNASPAATPATPASPYPSGPNIPDHFGQAASHQPFRIPHRPSQQSTGNYLTPQYPTTPMAFHPGQQAAMPRFNSLVAGPSNFQPIIQPDPGLSVAHNQYLILRDELVDLTQDDDKPPTPHHVAADPFPELENAYRGYSDYNQRPGPVDAFNQDYLSQAALAEFLITPTPPGGGYALNHGFNSRLPALDLNSNQPNLSHIPVTPGASRLNVGQHNVGLERELFGDDFDETLTPGANPEAVAGLIENIKPDHDVPPEQREQTPPDMQSELMPHQKLGLTWLKRMEEGKTKGGILADDMGLGKTVQALALILAHPSEDTGRKTTLIIAPVALMRQWEKEIQRHVKSDKQLKVYVYHGKSKKADFNVLRQYDVVLTTFGTLSHENKHVESGAPRIGKNKPALIGPECRWYRIIIDEAQCIKNKATQVSKATHELNSIYRLCLTGTPMMNSIDELFPLIRFLRVRPYNDLGIFNDQISKTVKNTKNEKLREKGMDRVRVLLRSIMLRRQKTTIVDGEEICKIPPKHVYLDNVEFSDDEHAMYKAIQTSSQLKFNKYLEKGTVNNNYAYILVLLLRLRQACCHPNLINDLCVQAATEGIEDGELEDRARKLSKDVVKRLKEEDSFECPICMEPVVNATIFLPCGHSTCGECFQKIIDPAQGIREGNFEGGAKCPHCRGPLSKNNITDYRHFCEVFCKEKIALLFGGAASDSDHDSDSDSGSEEEDEEDDDLGGFIVPDDVEDDFKPPTHEVKAESPAEDSKVTNKGKSKAKKSAKPRLTLAQLRVESLRNQAARRKYMKRLQKTWKSSAKIDKTMELISETCANDPTEKILIFSQFTSLLDLLEVPLLDKGFKYQRYDGSMRMDDRAEAVNKFMDESDQQIMLISLKAGNAGLNLNKASQVIILDPFWNPFIEDQAVDRAHRMPQQREVHVHRLLVPETVEDRIIALQDQKRELIMAALDESASRNISRLSIGDLMYLFGMGGR